MATSYHMEARNKQARLDRWNELKKRAECAPQETDKENLDSVSYKQKMDKVVTTDPGQFDVVRPKPTSSEVQFETGVIFQSVTHDPNFNFRLGKSMGRVPLHVDRIYKIIYPDSFYYAKEHPLPMFRVNEEGYCNRYRNRQHLAPHVDRAFAVMYSGTDNSDYTADDNVVNRRQNRAMDKYEVSKKVNGEFHMQLAPGAYTLGLGHHVTGRRMTSVGRGPSWDKPGASFTGKLTTENPTCLSRMDIMVKPVLER